LAAEIEPALAILLVTVDLTDIVPAIGVEYLADTSALVVLEFSFVAFTRRLHVDTVALLLEVFHFSEVDATVLAEEATETRTFAFIKDSLKGATKVLIA
jgi:hypothetical protein